MTSFDLPNRWPLCWHWHAFCFLSDRI